MFDWLVETFSAYPYAGVALVFLACGLGLPMPEEIVLMFAGYLCYQGLADTPTMMAVAIGSILLGDLIPFAAGRIYGPRLLRIRLMRMLVTPERLARFDRWFRRRGEFVVLISRFIAGIRVVSFFAAGTMRMTWLKFLALDLAGIIPIAMGLIWLADHYGGAIQAVIEQVRKIERGILIAGLAGGATLGVSYWLRWRRKQQLLVGGPAETYVEPTKRAPSIEAGTAPSTADAAEKPTGSPEPTREAGTPPPHTASPDSSEPS
jgi:membrane protein DedA with SNARE-associated domain